MSSTFILTQTYFGSKIDADLYIYKIASLDSRAVLHYYIDQITKCGNPSARVSSKQTALTRTQLILRLMDKYVLAAHFLSRHACL